MGHVLHHGDVLATLRGMPDNSFDALFTDPPYGLGPRERTAAEIAAYITGDATLDTGGDFMGRAWQIPSVETWREALRVLKPGAPLLCFAGPRNVDLVMIGIRAAGFEIRDEIAEYYSGDDARAEFLGCLDDAQRKLFARAFEASPLAAWITGQGFPKSKDNERAVSMRDCALEGRHFESALPRGAQREPGDHLCPKSVDGARFEGFGTALRPNHEPIILARKPLDGTIGENLRKWGVAGLAIDACRIATDWSDRSEAWKRSGHSAKPDEDKIAAPAGNGIECHAGGRWPSNVILAHARGCVPRGTKRAKGAAPMGPSPGCGRGPGFGHAGGRGDEVRQYVDAGGMETVAAFDCALGCPVAALDADGVSRGSNGGDVQAHHAGLGYGGGGGSVRGVVADVGGPSRFFFCPKADRTERDLGCEHLPLRSAAETTGSAEGGARLDSPRTGAGRTSGARNHNPCVKPIELCKYLAAMARPPARVDGAPRRMLVLYSGSGSEMIGALRAGWDEVIGIERDGDYCAIAEARLARWAEIPAHIEPGDVKPEKSVDAQRSLFATGGSR